MAFSLLSNRNALGKPIRFRSARAAGLVKPDTIETSYDNPLGKGDRTASITVTQDGYVVASNYAQYLPNTVDGSIVAYPSTANGAPALGTNIIFDFGTARHISEAKIWLYQTGGIGVRCWKGSNDKVTWSDAISANLDCKQADGITPITFPMLETFLGYYRYYGLVGVSGTIGNTYFQEIEFKIDAGV